MRPPLTLPPSRKWFPPHPWSVPTPFEVMVRENSEMQRTATLFQWPCAFISVTKEPSAKSMASNLSAITVPELPCVSNDPIET